MRERRYVVEEAVNAGSRMGYDPFAYAQENLAEIVERSS